MGDVNSAIADFTEVIQFSPQYADAYYNRGIVYLRKGDVDRAIADYTEVIRLGRGWMSIRITVEGPLRKRRANTTIAIADFTEAIRLSPVLPKRITTEASRTSGKVTSIVPSPISPKRFD